MNESDMPDKIHRLERIIEEKLKDPDGLIYTLIDSDTLKPFPEGFFSGNVDYFKYPGHEQDYTDFTGFLKYENVGMTTGAYISAMVLKHQLTGKPEPLKLAMKSFQALVSLYERCRKRETGYFCKSYGGGITSQTSSDQYTYVMAGMDRIFPYLEASAQEQAAKMVVEMTGWWMDKNYSYPYYGRPLHWPEERFAGFAWHAYKISGDAVFRREYKRLLRNLRQSGRCPMIRSWEETVRRAKERTPAGKIEQNSSRRLIYCNPEGAATGFLAMLPAIIYDSPDREWWLEQAARMFDASQRFIGNDGLETGPRWYDLDTGIVSPLKEVVANGLDNPVWKFHAAVLPKKSMLRTLMFARFSVQLAEFLDDEKYLSVAERIMDTQNPENLLWFIDVENLFEPEYRWAGHCYSGDAAVNWLWAYYAKMSLLNKQKKSTEGCGL